MYNRESSIRFTEQSVIDSWITHRDVRDNRILLPKNLYNLDFDIEHNKLSHYILTLSHIYHVHFTYFMCLHIPASS